LIPASAAGRSVKNSLRNIASELAAAGNGNQRREELREGPPHFRKQLKKHPQTPSIRGNTRTLQ
jgi:hypothetical protein